MINPQFPDETPAPVSRRMLRQFAALCFGIFGLLFVLSWHKHGGVTARALVAAAIAMLVGLPGLIWPSYIKPIFLGVMAVTQPIGHVMSTILLGVVYYVFLTPLALIFRWTGRDALARRNSQAASYWTPKMQPADPRQYLRQYQKQQNEEAELRSEKYHGASELNPR